jgi:hypothetical protein
MSSVHCNLLSRDPIQRAFAIIYQHEEVFVAAKNITDPVLERMYAQKDWEQLRLLFVIRNGITENLRAATIFYEAFCEQQ